MGLETPRSGTLHEAQQKVVNLLTPGGVPTEEGNPPEEQQETQVAQNDLLGQLEEESQDLESEEESPDYNEDDEEARTFKIRVKGQDKEVTESELIKLASMGEDYTKKTQDLSEQRKRLELIAHKSYPNLNPIFFRLRNNSNRSPIGTPFIRLIQSKQQGCSVNSTKRKSKIRTS